MSASDGPGRPPAPSAPTRREYLPVLDVVRIVAILGVVAVHTFALLVETAEPRSATWWAAAAIDYGAVWAVPVFVMLSGALTLHPAAHRRGPRHFYRVRAGRILPALVVWTLFYELVVGPLTGRSPVPSAVLRRAVDGDSYTHLYFLWLILGLYAISPVLAGFLAGRPASWARWLGGVALAWTAATQLVAGLSALTEEPIQPIRLGALTLFLPYIGYYVLGFAITAAPPRRGVAAVCLPLAGLLLGWTLLHAAYADQLPAVFAVIEPSYLNPPVLALSVALFAGMMGIATRWRVGEGARAWLRLLGNATFGVFLVHFAILLAVRPLVPGGAEPATFAGVAVTWLLTVVLSFAFALVASRVPGLRRIV